MGKVRNVYKILVGIPEGKRRLGRHRHKWEDNIKMDLRKICLEVVDWIYLSQEGQQWQVSVNMVKKLLVP
jgi:hypothetical protein